MTREPDPTGFDAIVAAWRAEGNVPRMARRPAASTTTAPTSRRARLTPADGGTEADALDRPETQAGRRPGPRGRRHARPARTPTGSTPTSRHPHAASRQGPTSRPDPDAGRPATPTAGRRTARRHRPAPPRTWPTGAARRAGSTATRPAPAADPHADEHFVPPEPPPLPRMGPPILVGLTLIGLGLLLVTFPGWVGVPQVYGLPLGLVAIAAGLGWLVLRLWPDPDDVPPPLYLDDPDDPDGGAVL